MSDSFVFMLLRSKHVQVKGLWALFENKSFWFGTFLNDFGIQFLSFFHWFWLFKSLVLLEFFPSLIIVSFLGKKKSLDVIQGLGFIKCHFFTKFPKTVKSRGVGHDVIKILNFSAIQCKFNRCLKKFNWMYNWSGCIIGQLQLEQH